MENERLIQLQQMLLENEEDVFVNYAIGLELYKTKSPEVAFQHMSKLAETHPDYCPVFFKMGQWLAESNNDIEALDWLNKALQIAEKIKDKKAINEIKEAIWLIE